MADLGELRRKLGFRDGCGDELLSEAFTHRSYAVEHGVGCDNQRLEFLGDAVLEIILTDHLFSLYPEATEGELTKMRSALARESTLAELASHLELGTFLRVGHGEAEAGGDRRVSTLADLFESVLGALYLHAGYEAARRFVRELLRTHYPDPKRLLGAINPKGALQEFSQGRWNETPDYRVLRVEGPEHSPMYTVEALLRGHVGCGRGRSRKAAECEAAKELLDFFRSPEFQDDGGN